MKVSHAQDILFSQFYTSPMVINPAHTGDHDRYWKFTHNYRTEWKSTINPFISSALAYDQQIFLPEHRFSAGIIYVFDRSGSYLLTKNKLYLSAAYHHEVPDFIYSGGIHFGIGSEKFNSESLTFPDQYDISTGAFNPSLPTTEEGRFQSVFYPDMNIGISVRKRTGRFIPHAGIAIQHINKPNLSYQKAGDNKLNVKSLFNFGGQYYITKKLHLQPSLLYVNQIKSNVLFFGAKTGIDMPRNLYELKNFFIGSHFIMDLASGSNSFVFSSGMEFYNFQVAISYDYNFTAANSMVYNRGAIELSIIYLGQTTELVQVTLPCDRY